MRNTICLILATLLFSTTTLEAKVGAAGATPTEQTGAERKPTLKERMLEVPPGTMIEVRLLNKDKIRGRLGELTDEGFGLTTAQGEKIETIKVSLPDVKSFKRLEGATAGKAVSKGVLWGLAGIGALTVIVVIWAASTGATD